MENSVWSFGGREMHVKKLNVLFLTVVKSLSEKQQQGGDAFLSLQPPARS